MKKFFKSVGALSLLGILFAMTYCTYGNLYREKSSLKELYTSYNGLKKEEKENFRKDMKRLVDSYKRENCDHDLIYEYTLFHVGDVQKSLSHFLEADKRAEEKEDLHVALAELFLEKEDLSASLYHFEQAFSSQPDNRELALPIALLNEELGNEEKAAKYLKIYVKEEEVQQVCSVDEPEESSCVAVIVPYHDPFEQESQKEELEVLDYSAETEFALGYWWREQGDFEKSLAAFLRGLERDPDQDEIVLQVGYLYDQLGKKQKAVSFYSRAAESEDSAIWIKAESAKEKLTVKPKESEVRGEALSLIKEGELEKALPYFLLALQLNPQDVPLRLQLAEIYACLGQKEKAFRFFEKAWHQSEDRDVKQIALEGMQEQDTPELSLKVGYLLETVGQREEAICQFEKVLESADEQVAKSADVALEQLQLAERVPSKIHFITDLYSLDMGYELLEEKCYSAALPLFQSALNRSPENAHLCLQVGEIYENLGESFEAFCYFQRAYEIRDPEVESLAIEGMKQLASTLDNSSFNPELVVSQILLDREEKEEALLFFRQAEQRDPKNKGITLQIGHLLDSAGDVGGAHAAYLHAILSEDLSVKREAFTTLKERFAFDTTRLERGYQLLNEKKYQEAYPFLYEAWSEKPKNSELTFQLGCLCHILDRKDEAFIFFYRAYKQGSQEMKKKAFKRMLAYAESC